MSTVNIPYINFEQAHVQDAVERLYEFQKETPRELRFKDYTLENGQIWTSWNVREQVYKKKMDTFPTMARGFFTKHTDGGFKVMARGYDKFFNILETKITQWPFIESDTEGPYEVTAKENGCIIFIAALSEEKVVITSKHSIPAVKDDPKAHAGVGYNWVLKHLASVEKSEKDLAEWLYDKNVTLVAELCDDEFEEHILPYTEKDRGLYLHGVNYNTIQLYTLPSSTVQQLAQDFGFHKTDFKLFDTVGQVREFGEEMQQTGLFDGREVEGAVVRCKRKGADFMFKLKNEQYLIYREYREVTKALIENHQGIIRFVKPEKELKITYEKTRHYIDWLRKRIIDHPEWFQDYKMQKGIIEVRQKFEKYWEAGIL
ncbi:RNA ligase-domain-containing protein [Gilbertella persicaria]|uniref:RNA ligase-domain-containing protein n=1 Tax=Gilbertella persicaria TaxID=101096 RepID=UPI00221E3BF3|nr:RNA ligase-domain-containing protein [Gilbertella persicaria]KAI8072146.1 RNA ligase-domain-containing protein [Gilbertella persicaria]